MKPIIGFIGLGIMGRPMVRNLLAAGYSVHVYNRSRQAVEELAGEGASVCETPADAADRADIVITMVSNTADVQEVILGPKGIIHSLRPGKIAVDMSTISPQATLELAERIGETGARMLDAPVSGGEKGAVEGTLSIMVGGEAETFERCLPIFEVLGKNVVHVGHHSAGQVVKACNQILAASTLAAMGEALVLGTKAGVDPQKIVDVLSMGAARCWALDVRAPQVLKRDFRPGFKSKLQYKDLGLALELSKSLDVPLAISGLVHEMYKSCIAQGLGEDDHSSIVRVTERLANVEINGARKS
ncbi:2-hydroxy-3-oxopropionate reductase [Paenibacillus sp.]|uniref:2-hydroxy-3-oxopropionate reductase n=1 Tax=Paenibacillus sp. TaxID=58172 RepID=UPI002D4F2B9E|nr:2-hydroxy-3-oxopropionate reductase [Paenibacillus sp.]HZG56237.1 2-hydroxy-3-oxopropionate reductase [Paenibacillus sp.]